MAAIVKHLSDRYPTGQLVFFRSFFGFLPIILWMVLRREFVTSLRTARPVGHLWRATIGTTGMIVYFLALARLPLPDVTAITYASPLITLVLASFLLKERIGIYRWSAVAVGLVGVLLILWPHLGAGVDLSGGAALGAIFALLTACGMALVMIQLRHLTRTEATSTIVFYFTLFSSLLALTTLPFGWVMPDLREGAILVGLGLIAGIGQILLTQSYRYAPASVVAPFEYTTMLWALLLGYIFFSEVPQFIVLFGAAIVIAAGLFVIYRERKLGIARAARAGPES